MDIRTFFLALTTMVSWGVSAFVDKLAANRIGVRSVLWSMIGYAPVIFLFVFLAFRTKGILAGDRTGIWLAILAGIIGSLGAVSYYAVLARREASSAVPLTALYPLLTAVLAFIFLREQLTLVKGLGILLATGAIVLLSL